jgi:hypothetical protein
MCYGSYLSVSIIIISIFTPIIMFYSVYKNRANLNDEDFILKYGTLTERLNQNNSISIYWNSILILRWLLTITILIVLREVRAFK